MMTRTVLGAVAIAVLLLAGCGEEPRPVAAAGTPTATPTDGNGEILSKKQAKAALLTIEDLPAGWTAVADEDDEEDDSTIKPRRCADVMDGLDKRTGEPVAEAKASFASGPTAFLEHTVESFEQDTAALVELAADAFRKCPKITSIEPDGTKVTFRIRSMSFPELGDRTLAMRATGSADGVEVILDLVYIAKGHNGVGISAGGLTPVPGADLEAVARKALAKLG